MQHWLKWVKVELIYFPLIFIIFFRKYLPLSKILMSLPFLATYAIIHLKKILYGALRDLVPFVQFKKREKHP